MYVSQVFKLLTFLISKITSSHGSTLQYGLCTFDGWIIIEK